MMRRMSIDLNAAADFMATHARMLDRRRFELRTGNTDPAGALGANPLAGQVRIFRVVPRPSAGHGRAQRRFEGGVGGGAAVGGSAVSSPTARKEAASAALKPDSSASG